MINKVKVAIPFLLLCLGIGVMAGAYIISPHVPEPQTTLVENKNN